MSVGIGERVFTTKLTKGQKNALDRFWDALKNVKPAIADFKAEAHKEDSAKLDFKLTLFITDSANVAGHSVEADGAYLEYEGNLYSFADINEYFANL